MLPDLITMSQQKLILLIYDEGFVTSKEQTVYKPNNHFYLRVGQLIRKKIIKATKNYESGYNQYSLTTKGQVLAKILRGEKI